MPDPGAQPPAHPAPRLLRVEDVMGMPVRIDVRDPDVPEAALDAAFAWLRHADAVFSTYRAGSAVSRLNRGELASGDPGAPPELAEVLARCAELRDLTGGWFDIAATVRGDGGPDAVPRHDAGDRRDPAVRLPGAVDPSGLVKGWAVERAGRILEEHGARNWSVNAGGDIRLRGGPRPGEPWRVGIQHPLRDDALAAVVESRDLALATSGAYERGDHVLDPFTGLPPEGILSVSIAGDDLGTADAYATAAFAMGPAAAEWAQALPGYEALVILGDGLMVWTPGFPLAGEGAPARPRLQLRATPPRG